jgi:hypothetical protein
MRLDSGDSSPTLTAMLLSVTARLAAPLTGRFSRRRVAQWCRRQGYQLLRWRDAKLFEGPSTWAPEHDRYRIQVLDEEGHHRAGYLVFQGYWRAARRAEVLWDEPGRAQMNGTPASRAQTVK